MLARAVGITRLALERITPVAAWQVLRVFLAGDERCKLLATWAAHSMAVCFGAASRL